MASNEFALFPVVCRLRSTSGKSIDLLDQSAFFIRDPGWTLQVTKLKGGGVRIASQSLDSDHLVAGGYENVAETLPLGLGSTSVALHTEKLMLLLWDAEAFALENWQREAVYLEIRLKEDSDLRYSRVITGSFRFGDFSFGERSGFPDNTLILEREPYWHDRVPGELLGPFENMAKNPSFEWWGYEGISRALPTGWWETVEANFPAGPVSERESEKVAGSDYGLKMSFSGNGNAANNRWYLWQNVMLRSSTTYTIRFWLHMEVTAGTPQFFVEILDSTGAVTYLNQTYTASPVGNWVHLTFDTDRFAYPYCVLRVGVVAPAGAQAATVYLDRISLLMGTWALADWPGDFYMDSSIIWDVWDPEDYVFVPVQPFPVNMDNILDIRDVPGDVDAITRLSFAHLVGENVEDATYALNPINRMFAFLKKDQQSDELRRDPDGHTDVPTQYVGRDHTTWVPSSVDWENVYSFQVNGDDVTKFMMDQFRVVARVRANDPEENERVWKWRIKYWVGDVANARYTEEVTDTYAAGDSYHMLYLTPKNAIDWQFPPLSLLPASLGFTVQVKWEDWEEGSEYAVLIDCVMIGPSSQGMVYCIFDPVMDYLQGLIMDSDDASLPVARGYAEFSGVDPRLIRDVLHDQVTASRVYDERLVVSYSRVAVGSAGLYLYDPTNGWVAVQPYAGAGTSWSVNDFEIWEGFLYFVSTDGDIFIHYHGKAVPYVPERTIAGTPDLHYIQAFGEWLYIAANDRVVYSWDGVAATAEVVAYTHATQIPKRMAAWKHRLWVGYTTGVTMVWNGVGWGAGPQVPDAATIQWLLPFQDRLYALTADNHIYRTGDGFAWDLVATIPANRGMAHKMILYDGKIWALFGNDNAVSQALHIYMSVDGVTWTEEVGIDLNPVGGVVERGTMSAYCGRIFAATSALADQKTRHVWHCPVVARISAPSYTGNAFRLSPKVLNRMFLVWSQVFEWFPDLSDWRFLNEYISQIQAKIWIDPRWRSLREN